MQSFYSIERDFAWEHWGQSDAFSGIVRLHLEKLREKPYTFPHLQSFAGKHLNFEYLYISAEIKVKTVKMFKGSSKELGKKSSGFLGGISALHQKRRLLNKNPLAVAFRPGMKAPSYY